ncbi:lipopolysaccharide biosynthesis protein [Vampirovibrio sp.]|uniref:lipopolysaccharide biosynthesis protein n=1 Tax=Vampirovibrio sp. TaxID=2717857 RepID=UPI003593E68D
MSKTHASSDPFSASRKSGSLLKNLGITFFETIVTKGFNFLIILMLTRALGPEDYGKYSFIFVMIALSSALFDFGMENTAVRFAARDKDEKQSIFGLYLSVKLGILMVLVLFLVLGNVWFFELMHKSGMSQYTPFLILGLLGESLFFVNDTYLQASQRFKLRAWLNISRFGLSLLWIIFLLYSGQLFLERAMLIYWIPLIFSLVFLGKYVGFLKAFWSKALNPKLLSEIIGYERWMLIYSVANNLIGRLDFFMLGLWVSYAQLGIYNAAVQLCAIISFLPLVLGKVLLPTLAELDEVQIFRTTGKMIRGTGMMALGAVLLIPASIWLVPLLLGSSYQDSVGVLQILVLAFLAGLMSMPYEQALYSLGKPDILCGCRYAQLIVIVLLNCWIIPVFGVYGAAAVTFLGRVLYLLQIRWFYLKFQSSVSEKPLSDLAVMT